MKRAALILFFLILFMSFCPSYSEASLDLFVENDKVDLKHPLVMMNGNFMIPLWVFEAHFGAEITVVDDQIEMVFTDQIILMQVGVESAQVNGDTFPLDSAPQVAQGEITVPLRFIADRRNLSLVFVQDINGLRIEKRENGQKRRFTGLTSQASSELSIESITEPTTEPSGEQELISDLEPWTSEPLVIYEPEEEVQDLEEIIFMGGPKARVFLDLRSYTGYQTHLLQEPDRLVLDLFGVQGDSLPTLEVDDPVIRCIRSSRFDDETLRIVFDLEAPTGHTVTPWPEGGLEIEFNYQLSNIWVEEQNGNLQLGFHSSAAPEFEAVYLEDPLRLVIDFQESTLITRSFDVAVDLGLISRFRVSQHMPGITRVVLELKEPVAPLQVEGRDAGTFILPLFVGTRLEAQRYLASETAPTSAAAVAQEPTRDGILSGLTIAVDPGHGGSDPGAIGYHGTFEKDVNLAISLYLGEYLSEAGARVVYTRDQDVYVSIFDRPEIAVQGNADLFVSVHANSHIERGKARGTETLYRANDTASEVLARAVQDEVVKAITLVNRRIWGRGDLAVFNGSQMPAIMVEVGFLDHPDEEVLLRASGFQRAAAQGIYNGIERFYLENKH